MVPLDSVYIFELTLLFPAPLRVLFILLFHASSTQALALDYTLASPELRGFFSSIAFENVRISPLA